MSEEAQTPGVGYDEAAEDVVDIYKNFSLSQPIRIPKQKLNPQYVYRWINRLNKKNYQRKRGMGWVMIKADDLEDLVREGVDVNSLHLGTHVDAEGNVALGEELVLARMPAARAQAIKDHLREVNEARTRSGRKKFHETGRLAGVSTHEEGY